MSAKDRPVSKPATDDYRSNFDKIFGGGEAPPMNAAKEKLITDLIDRRIANIRDMSMEEEWMADVMNFGWIGYDKHSDEELLENAESLLDGPDDYIPSLEELK